MSLQNTSIKVTHFIIGGFDTVKRPIAVGVGILITYLLVVIANVLNILFIIFDKRLHKPMYLLICNLAVVDLMYTSSTCPTMIGVLLAGVNTIPYVDCFIQLSIFNWAGVMVSFALVLMAFDRLIAIIYPFQYHSYVTNTRTLGLTYILYVIAFGFVAVMPATAATLPYCTSRMKYTFCDFAAVIRTTCVDPNYYFNLVLIITLSLLFFTFSFIGLSYIVIAFLMKFSTNRDKKKMASTCVSHLIVVTCYYSPLFVLIALTRVGVVLTLEERQGLLIGNILGPAVVNPFVYCFRTKEIKNKIFKIFTKKADISD
ncbi:olfactory receptor 13G1-like [Pelmatolapia mariae]|uniref:olfactory receptor 13G1-like n=1 Tax=Pelmatolapia mariae TaxID=158779 RepID=UPI002FE66560